MPKVSILVPIYNVECYLRECLDSLINQTLQDIEIICINDGSTDSSADILEEYSKKDNRIKIINKENSGYGASMNMGLGVATGEYIGIVESDDFVKNIMFEDLYKFASKNDADLVKSDFYYYTTYNNRSRQAGKIKRRTLGKVFNVKDDCRILKMMPTIWSAIYKREFLIKNGIKFLETPGASYQDTSFAFKTLSAAKRIMFTNKAYLYYRCDNANSSVKSKGKVFAICDEWGEISRFLDERLEIKEIVNDIKLTTQYNAYMWNAIRIDESFLDEFIDRFQTEFKAYFDNNEINKNFYKKVSRSEFETLLNNKEEFKKIVSIFSEKQEQKLERQKAFSVRINTSRISIVLFGKQMLEIGK